MSKLNKIIIIFASIGFALCIFGAAFGGHFGMYLDKDGFHATPKHGLEITRSFDDVTNIYIKYDNSKVEIIPGSEFSVIAKYMYGEPKIEFDNGNLEIYGGAHQSWFNIGFTLGFEKLTVTIPTGSTLEKLRVYNDNGAINISSEVYADIFYTEGRNGSIRVGNITATEAKIQNKNGAVRVFDLTAETVEVQNRNGSITLGNFTSTTGKIRCENGSITVDGIAGRNEFKNENGSIKISAFYLDNFYIQAYTENGSCKLNGEKIKYPIGNKSAPNQIIAENQNGSIKIFDK
ncbi:MAG: DUF4097 domain-containing protein [Oscillospiraceae bacterium]|nr:DUF4097 domain-containing protein [Oscillospiraceae bacterium]